MYYQSKAEIEEHIRQAGEQAVFEANCGDFHEELVKILGRLRFRTSYGQNVLKHTLEVVHLAGIMAAELGASVKTARRAALLHDIGKALTHEVEGSHALALCPVRPQVRRVASGRPRDRGAPLRGRAADRRGRAPDRRRRDLGVTPRRARREPRALHQAARGPRGGRFAPRAASRRSTPSRPAARSASSCEPKEIDDDGAVLLSHEIAREIEDQLEYPGQIKVTVIRESRAIEFAK